MALLFKNSIIQFPRLAYMLNYLFTEQFEYNFTIDVNFIDNHLLLSPSGSDSCLSIKITSFLTNNDVNQDYKTWFLKIADQRLHVDVEGSLSFDVLSAQFFLLSRYEEYLPHSRDKFDRFPAIQSVLYHLNLLQTPVVDRWTIDLMNCWNRLFHQFPISIRKPKNEYIFTFDIDKSFAFRYASIFKITTTISKSIVLGRWKEAIWKLKIWFGQEKDPFDNFELINKLNMIYGVEPRIFVLCGKSQAQDENLGLKRMAIRKKVLGLTVKSQFGIHPSIQSTSSVDILKKEIEILQETIGVKIFRSRQHYLKLNIPLTYRDLLSVGIEEDYSMGFADHIGFRAGTSKSFKWFDLTANIDTKLTLFPFCAMDTTLCDYMHLKPLEAIAHIANLHKVVELNHGVLCLLFHHESPGDYGRWKGWGRFYEQCLRSLLVNDNSSISVSKHV